MRARLLSERDQQRLDRGRSRKCWWRLAPGAIVKSMPPHPAAALLGKRWDLLAYYKDQYWRDRKRLGLREALRVVDSLRAQVRCFQPDWLTQDDRDEDLETHLRVAAALSRAGGREAHSKRSQARKTRRRARVR